MYKVYFNNRTVYLTDNYKANFGKFDGLFYKYESKNEFKRFWEYFEVMSSSITNLFIIHNDVDKLVDDFNTMFHLINAAGGLVVNNESKVLVIKRFGKWDLPKGKVDKGENIKDAAIREVQEECGIKDIKIIKELQPTYHTYYLNNQQILKKTHWYEMLYEGNDNLTPQYEEDITEVTWVEKEELNQVIENTYKSIVDVLSGAGKLV